jgi:hypothetical protein
MPNRPPQAEDLTILHHRDPETYLAVSVAGSADVTLTLDQCLATALELTGAITANISVIFPLIAQNVGKTWRLKNSTTGAFTVTAKVTSQTGFVVERGEMPQAVMNGTDLYRSATAKIPRRFELRWVAGQRGKPGLNALVQNSVANYSITDPYFEILGTNAVSADTAYNAEGGITLNSHGADNDQTILLPHLTTNLSPWTAITWGSDQETQWEAHVKAGSAVTAQILWAGLKLTNTPTAATDNDSVYFRYQNGVNSGNWQALYSINNVDVAVDTGIAAAANQEILFQVLIDASRIARMYLNGLLVATTTPLTDATDFIPYLGVQASGAAAVKSLRVFGQVISRKYA